MTDVYDQAAALPVLLRCNRAPRRPGGTRPRSADWSRRRRSFRGAYLLGCAPANLLDRLRAVLAALPAATVLSHHTAAALYGFGVLRTPEVHVAVAAGGVIPQRRGVAAHECALAMDGVVEIGGLPCLPPARCAIDLARTAPRRDALAVLDAALRVDACTRDELLSEVARHDRLRGVRQARELIPLATPLAECRQETHLRLLLHDAHLPPPRPQLTVVDRRGVERHHIDLGYEDERVGLEYDGAARLDRLRMRRDRYRHTWLTSTGWRMCYITDDDLYGHPELLVRSVRAALFRTRAPVSLPAQVR